MYAWCVVKVSVHLVLLTHIEEFTRERSLINVKRVANALQQVQIFTTIE